MADSNWQTSTLPVAEDLGFVNVPADPNDEDCR